MFVLSKYFCFICFYFILFCSFSQKGCVYLGIGSTQFLSDLGDPLKFKPENIRGAFTVGYEHFLTKNMSAEVGGLMTKLYADDTKSNSSRNKRGINVKTDVYQLSISGKFYFLRDGGGKKEFGRGRYLLKYKRNRVRKNFRNNRNRKFSTKKKGFGGIDLYITGGVTALFFEPKATYDGVTYKLRDYKTGGQGLPGADDVYGKIAYGIPVEFGVSKTFGRRIGFDFRVAYYYIFSDYLDDASGDGYYNNQEIQRNYGRISAFLSNPTTINMSENDARAFKRSNDNYIIASFRLKYAF